MAAIGSGGQGASNISGGGADENIVALCDVDDRRAAQHVQALSQGYRSIKTSARCSTRKGKNIDAVIVAIPDHMHATAAMWCMERGKHVYVQKPLVRTIWEARQLRAAATKYRRRDARWATRGIRTKARDSAPRSSGMATSAACPRSTPGATGRCGRRASPRFPPRLRCPSTLDWDLWLGCAEKRPFTSGGGAEPDRNGGFFYQPFNWRGFYDFGCGALGDMACHILGAPNMALHLSQRRVDRRGVRQKGRHEPLHVPEGSVIRFDFAAYGNMPALKIFWYDGLKETPKIEGVPAGEWLGDPPSAGGAGGGGRGRGALEVAADAARVFPQATISARQDASSIGTTSRR